MWELRKNKASDLKARFRRLQGFSDANVRERKKEKKTDVRKELAVRLDEHQVQHQVYICKCQGHADG